MAISLNTSLQIKLNALQVNPEDLVSAEAPFNYNKVITLVSGFVADAADRIWSDTRTLGTGATDDLDMAGALVDAFANAFTPAKVKVLIVYSHTTNTTNLTVGTDANSVPIFLDKSDGIVIKPGGIFLIADPTLAGYAVTGATGDIIQITNAAGPDAVYDIFVVGTSA